MQSHYSDSLPHHRFGESRSHLSLCLSVYFGRGDSRIPLITARFRRRAGIEPASLRDPGRTRTYDTKIKSLLFYPTELRDQCGAPSRSEATRYQSLPRPEPRLCLPLENGYRPVAHAMPNDRLPRPIVPRLLSLSRGRNLVCCRSPSVTRNGAFPKRLLLPDLLYLGLQGQYALRHTPSAFCSGSRNRTYGVCA